ncbi:UPF0739 protein C1orf74 homolog isoform X1 [Leucoraja erinacea]|uniref:UPF0739 protein C1orf74 homolog isoform X1 n=1 Tax=Leucoraja erinaceus TaxID=7782 RepID=UPI002455C6AF|nr:UPF0739 protein C1orf74 homolog isoform X1 [Leucoraja erinacea]
MEAVRKELLVFMTQKYLRMNRKKGFSKSRCLQLAAEILAVDSGLKPSFLFDYCASNAEQIQNYVQELWKTGLLSEHLHVLSIQDNILITNLNRTIRHLERTLQGDGVPVIDVSLHRKTPQLAESWVTQQVEAQVDIIWKHLKSQEYFWKRYKGSQLPENVPGEHGPHAKPALNSTLSTNTTEAGGGPTVSPPLERAFSCSKRDVKFILTLGKQVLEMQEQDIEYRRKRIEHKSRLLNTIQKFLQGSA